MRKKQFLIAITVYALTWVLVLGLFLIRVLGNDTSFSEAIHFFLDLLAYRNFQIVVHLIFLGIYLLFLALRYFLRTYRKKGLVVTARQFGLRFLAPMLGLGLIFKLLVFANSNEAYTYQWDYSVENRSGRATDLYSADEKHRGMSVFGWRDVDESAIDALIKNNIEWVALTPFFYQKSEETPTMGIPEKIGIWSRRDSVFLRTIKRLHAKGLRVQLKPHLWMDEGWRSNVRMPSQTAWSTWFESYRKNMVHFAMLAQQTGVELFCVGTELKSSLKNQPEQWRSLVREIKSIYRGKLTYAANWDGEYRLIDFWGELDYIGIQAYFPLTKHKNPDLEAIKKGWDRHLSSLATLSKEHRKPILFTEVGYKSEASSTIKPWEWGSAFSVLYHQKSDRTQQLAFEALFEKLWEQEWFRGTYIWQWDTRTSPDSTFERMDFSPRYKPAENTIAKWYGSGPID